MENISEKYRIERINKSIEYYKKEKTKALVTMYSAIELCDHLSESAKQKAKNIINELQTAKTKKKHKVIKQLENRLNKDKKRTSYTFYHEAEEIVKKYKDKYHVDLDYLEISKIANKITPTPSTAAISAAHEYVSYSRQIEYLKEQLRTPLKTEKTQEETKNTLKTTATISPTTEKTLNTTKEIIPQPYTYSDSENIKYQKTLEYLTTKYQKEAENKTFIPKVYFSEEDRKMIEILLSGNKYENYGTIQRIEDLIENSYSIEATLNKFKTYKKTHMIPFKTPHKPDIKDLLEMAAMILDELPKELVTMRSAASESSIFLERLTHKAGIMNYLEKYEEAYNIYLNYYNKLDDNEKQKIKNNFEENISLRFQNLNISEFSILKPNELKNLINSKVSKLMCENYRTYGNSKEYDTHDRLKKATTFMDTRDIAQVYYQLKKEKDKYIVYSTMSEEDVKDRREWFEQLQKNFAYLLISKLTKEEKKDKTTDQQLHFVCKEYLNEEPIFKLNLEKTIEEEHKEIDEIYNSKKALKEATRAEVTEDAEYTINNSIIQEQNIEEITNTAIAAGYNARNRFFGMKKVEQTIQHITGKWSQFERTWQRAQQAKTTEEIENITNEFNRMFR